MKVIRNYIYNASYQLLIIIVPLITSAYISRVLGPKGVGINSFTNSIIQYFILIADIGIAYYGNREVAYIRDDKDKLSQTFWEIQILKCLMVLFSTCLFLIFMFFYPKNKIYMFAQVFNLLAAAFDISWFYQGIEDFKRTVIKNVFIKILSLLLIFAVVKNSSDLTKYIIILGLSSLIGNLTLWPHMRKILTNKLKFKINILKHLYPTLALFLPQIATTIYLQINRTMLGVFSGETSSGYYQYSDNLIHMVIGIITATGTVMLPHVANAYSSGNMKKVNNLLYTSFNFVTAISMPMMFGLASIAKLLVPIYYGPGYFPVINAMMIESIIIVMIGWSNAIGTQYLLPINKVKEFNISVFLGAIINIVLNIPLINLWGLNGAILSTVISETSVTFYQILVVKKLLNYKKLFSGTIKYTVSGIIVFVWVVFLNNELKLNAIFVLIIDIVSATIIYIILLIVLRTPIIKLAFNIIKNKERS
ncbi:flippase [Limosilactobacillus reuteri]|uniref:flippase n=1 Tax=Limosilactobacillus reuteri TaxID=1598 RepID=UPI003D094415